MLCELEKVLTYKQERAIDVDNHFVHAPLKNTRKNNAAYLSWPVPNIFETSPGTASKNLNILTQKLFLSSPMILVVHPGFGS